MIRIFLTLLRREIFSAYGLGPWHGKGTIWLPILFFLSAVIIYPFAIGPDIPLIKRTGGGVIWIAALLAAILPIDRLVAPDSDQGMIDHMVTSGVSEELIAWAKIIGHWLSFGPPVMLAALIGATMMNLSTASIWTLEIGLALASPGLAALGVMIAALTAHIRHGAALGGLLLLPLAIPMLIFGSGAMRAGGENGLLLLAAMALFILAFAPFASAAAMRAGRE